MPNAPANVIDALNSLLEVELSGAFRLIESDFPYLSRANADIRKTITELLQLSDRNARELADLIDSLGGVVIQHNIIQREGQYLAYLSIKFLLPKLVAERELALDRYKNTRLFIGAGQPGAVAVLDHIIAEQEQYLVVLRKAGQSTPRSADIAKV